MKGTHLARLALDLGRVLVPMKGMHLEVERFDARKADLLSEGDLFYLVLDGEVVLDLPQKAFVHLRSGEATSVPAGTPHTLSPIEAVILLSARPT